MAYLEPASSHSVPVYQTAYRPMRVPPYIEWRLDRWKFAVLIPLFLLLLVGAVYRQRVSLNPSISGTPADSGSQSQPDFTQPTSTEEISLQPETGLVEGGNGFGNGLESGAAVAQTSIADRVVVREYNQILPLPINNVAGQIPIMPVTLVKPAPDAAVTQTETAMISGTAAPGSQVIIDHGVAVDRGADGATVYETQILGEVQTGADGRWQLWLAEPLAQGTHRLSIKQIDMQSGMQTTITPVDFTVVDTVESSLSNLRPTINSPQPAARLSVNCVGSGIYRFQGTAMPGWLVQLYINEQPAGKGRVGINQSWEVAMEKPLVAGSYIARTVLLSPGGEVATESSPVAFTMHTCQ